MDVANYDDFKKRQMDASSKELKPNINYFICPLFIVDGIRLFEDDREQSSSFNKKIEMFSIKFLFELNKYLFANL